MRPLRLVQFTDTHLLGDPQGGLRGVRTRPSLEACLAHARRRHYPADAIVLTGDLVHDHPDGYDALRELFADSDVPVLLLPGNHDDLPEMRRRFPREPFQVCGTRVLGHWAILLLDTSYETSGRGEGRLGPAELAALDAELSRQASRHALVCLHHPPIEMETAGLDALRLQDGPEFLEVVGRHANVRAIAWGHAHQSLDRYAGALRLMCTPATCMQFRPRDPGFVIDDRPPGYRVLDLGEDGSLATEVVWLEGYRP